jgi:hypothetical protein
LLNIVAFQFFGYFFDRRTLKICGGLKTSNSDAYTKK